MRFRRYIARYFRKDRISKFCHYRQAFPFDTESLNQEYLYVDKSNASRCFYNFFTTTENYQKMYDICRSIRFKSIYYDLANQIASELPHNRNQYNIFLHLRFGDIQKNSEFIERANPLIIKNILDFVDGHLTNTIRPSLYLMVDNLNNPSFFDSIKKYYPTMITDKTRGRYQKYVQENSMIFFNTHHVKNYGVVDAIIEMIIASKGDEFVGYVSSTFSHYIQFLRFCSGRSCDNYSNLNYVNSKYCRLMPLHGDREFQWNRLGFSGGHVVSWHYFFKPFERSVPLFSIDGKTDGFGSQLQACFSLIAYCEYKGYEYIHKPFYRMQHNDKNELNFCQIMNDFCGLGFVFRNYEHLTSYEQSKIHFVKEGFFAHGSKKPNFFYTDVVLQKIRRCYNHIPKAFPFDSKKYNVVIHVRRGDVNRQKYPSRYISNKEYLTLLETYSFPENTSLHLISEGVDKDFADFTDRYPFISLYLNTSVRESFHMMVVADLLIISKSSFAYCAGLLNNNNVDGRLISSWWHKPLDNWVINHDL